MRTAMKTAALALALVSTLVACRNHAPRAERITRAVNMEPCVTLFDPFAHGRTDMSVVINYYQANHLGFTPQHLLRAPPTCLSHDHASTRVCPVNPAEM